jgi:hypothetical protein
MKKFTVLALAALLVVAFAMPASALENIFGGYWHTRFVTQKNFDGDDTEALDISEMNTRTRIYYTAKLNDNLKLVNKFEMDTVWGNKDVSAAPAGTLSSNFGDAGADGVAIEIKNTYADFNVGPVNFLVGIQNFKLGRGFISDDDASGMKAIWKVNDGLYLPFVYQKVKEGGAGKNANAQDVDAYIFAPIIMLSKDIKLSPYYAFFHAQDANLLGLRLGLPASGTQTYGLADDVNVNIAGFDFDAKMGAASLWLTGIYQFGSLSTRNTSLGHPAGTDIDLKGYLLAAGGKFDLGKADVHGQVFYATGEEKGLTDKEYNAYFTTTSTTYYWAEILGAGVFDGLGGGSGIRNSVPYSYDVGPSNTLAVNLGVTVKPMDKLSVTADLWYAKLAEKNAFNKDKLGVEADLRITYKLIEGLTLDVVGAYLFAGDAVSADGNNDSNPYEYGTQLSLSF